MARAYRGLARCPECDEWIEGDGWSEPESGYNAIEWPDRCPECKAELPDDLEGEEDETGGIDWDSMPGGADDVDRERYR